MAKLVTEAELNQVYSELAGEPTDDVTNLPVPEVPQAFQDDVDAVVVAANAGALVSLSPPKTKRKERAAQPDSTLGRRSAIRATQFFLVQQQMTVLAILNLRMTEWAVSKVMTVSLSSIAGSSYMTSVIDPLNETN